MVVRGMSQIVEDGLYHRWSEFLGGKAIATPDHFGKRSELAPAIVEPFIKRCDAVLVERLASSTRFFCAIQHGNGFHGSGQRLDETLAIERPIQTHLDQPDLLTVLI